MSYRGYRRGRSASKYKRSYGGRKRGRGYAAARRYPRNKGYHPYGKMMRPYSSVPRDFKTFDTLSNSYTGRNTTFPFNHNGKFFVLNTVQNGASFWQRVGRQICMKSLELFYEIRPTGTNPVNQFRTCSRLLVVYDRQPNGAPPVIAQILAAAGQVMAASGATTPFGLLVDDAWAEPNPVYKDRFVILRSVKGILPGVDVNGDTQFKLVQVSCPLLPLTEARFLTERRPAMTSSRCPATWAITSKLARQATSVVISSFR